ncbi:helix-turn-helix domain-containing protein [Pseudobacteroides cellulosolvens]|uniref:DNA binding domain-containing protein n=1 Tax=Pseudobacteroides cellulosolvens ATCC 35603 = DSM 2933 TaxID=398512 RepID=A0A0L6JGM6_9FIRM|nr:helix-turn-helix domain-containing protein [Pseudobacteroides cellulosolvens]KNY25021.1 DNA binding domain-containing protein [Pseudobacteroides cellulosolvens ATCC 35603 = DSM 2933]
MNLENKITSVDQLPLSLTVSDISHILGISKQNAYNLCHSESFPSIQIGKRIIITKLAFIEWMKKPKNNIGV